MQLKKITIIGLGLIGGSLAKAINKNSICETLVGIDGNLNSIEAAKQEGVIQAGDTSIQEYVYDSDMIVICTPVLECIKTLHFLHGKVKPDCIISDVSSTKLEIINCVNAMENPPIFVGGHPMAGKEKSGYLSADADLFNKATYLVTPSKSSTPDATKILTKIIKTIGANPILIEAEEHDKVLSGASHMPHIMAASMVTLLNDPSLQKYQFEKFIGGGFIDTTRVASSNPIMWEQILLSNSNNIIAHLEIMENIIKNLKTYIQEADSEKINQFFKTAKTTRDYLISNK